MTEYIVHDRDGNVLKVGDEVTDFRGTKRTFKGVTRGPEWNGTSKILLGHPRHPDREVYDRVAGITVEPVKE